MPKIVVQTDDEDFAKLCRTRDHQIYFVSLTQKEARKLCGDHALCVDDESGHGGDLDTALDYAQGNTLTSKYSRVYVVIKVEV